MELNGNLVFSAPGFGEIRNAIVERLTTDPVTGLSAGRIYYNTVAEEYRYYDGTAASWKAIGASIAVSLNDLTDVDVVGSPTLTAGMVLTYNGVRWAHETPDAVITDHTALSNIGTNTHAQIDTHIATGSPIHFTQAEISITTSQVSDFTTAVDTLIGATNLEDLANVASQGSPAIIAGMVLTYNGTRWQQTTPASGVTDHTLLSNIGTNTHAQIDTHIGDATIHFTEGSIDHTNITNVGTNTHAQIDTHIATGSPLHYPMTAISITESQISDFGSYEPANANIQTHIATGSPIHFLQSEISITKSQVSDFGTYVNQYIYDSKLAAGSPTASISHTITHNIGQRFVEVVVYEDEGSPTVPVMIIPEGVALNSSTVCTVSFAFAQDCYAVISGDAAMTPAGG